MRPCRLFPLLALTIPGLLAACADPVVVPPAGAQEAAMDCPQLMAALQEAQQAKSDARAEDRAKFSYLFVVPAYVSWYRMDQAEDAAQERIRQLELLTQQKQCSGEAADLPQAVPPAAPATPAPAP